MLAPEIKDANALRHPQDASTPVDARPRWRHWRRGLFVVALLLANGGLAERVAARYLPPPPDPPRLYRPHPTRFWAFDGPGWRSDPMGNKFYINALGMRADEPSPTRADLTVMLLGDSCVFGLGLDSADTLDRQLEQRLSRLTGRTVRVLNAGCPAYSSYQGRDWFGEIGPIFRPDVVLVAYRYADRGKEPVPDNQRQGGFMAGRIRAFLWRSAIYQVVRNAIQGPSSVGDTDGYDPTRGGVPLTQRVSYADFEDNLRAIAVQARGLGARGVGFVLLPNIFHEDGTRVDHNASLYTVGEREGLVIDGTLLWKGRPDVAACFYDEIHFNARGAGAFADDLAEALVKSGWLTPAASLPNASPPVAPR